METQKIWFFYSSKLNFDLCWCWRAEITYLRQCQSYISNWYINGKVFTSTTTWKSKKSISFFFKKVRNWILTCTLDCSWRAEITLASVNISPTSVNDAWMGRSSRVLYHEKSKIWFYKKKCLTECFNSAVIFCKQF